MTEPSDPRFWDERWANVLRDHGEIIADRPPNNHLTEAVDVLRPGLALDAGCGHGAETLWLARRGWRVTAVDFSRAALEFGRSAANAIGPDVAARIDWIEADLASWKPQAARYDLVACLYVHISGSVAEMVQRMATGVLPGGTLLLVGHRPIDPSTGDPSPAAGQVQVSVEEAVAALDQPSWRFVLAEDRPRAEVDSGVDAVICARRLS